MNWSLGRGYIVMKRIVSLILILAMTVGLAACNKSSRKSRTDRDEDQETEYSEQTYESLEFDEGTDMKTKLLALDSVVSVDEIDAYNKGAEGYRIVFERPLDPKDPSKGTFELHVCLSYMGDDVPNVFYCNGYGWHVMVEATDNPYATSKCKCNCIRSEYRFYGFSAPEGLDNKSTDLWKYLTSENAASDFHFEIEQFKRILSGKWCFSGGSKGGVATLLQSMYYPDDADVYYALSTPLMYSNDYPGVFDFIYNDIGNDYMDPEEAAELREMVLQLQVDVIKHSDTLEEDFQKRVKNYLGDELYSEIEDKHMLWDIEVLMAGFGIWQMMSSPVLLGGIDIREYVEDTMSIEDEEERAESAFNIVMMTYDDPKFFTSASFYYPYIMEQNRELGLFSMDFSYIREELRKQGCEDSLYITEEMEEQLYARSILTPEQVKEFPYNPEVMENLKKHLETTDCTIVVVNGTADVWYAYTPEQPDNPNVHIFSVSGAGHEADGGRPDEVYDILSEEFAPCNF